MSRKESSQNTTTETERANIVVTTASKRKRTVRRASSLRPRKSSLSVRSVRPLKAILNTVTVETED